MFIHFSNMWTVFLRSFYAWKRDFNKLLDLTYWPIIDLVIYGFMSVGLVQNKEPKVIMAFMTALLLWQVVYRANLEISRNMLQEIWDNNLINMLTTPLTLLDWLGGLMFTGFLGVLFAVPFGALIIYLLYGYNVFSLGMPLLTLTALLVLSGWALGLLGSSILVRGGQRVESIVWALGWLPAPFCSVFYPSNVLPQWAQAIGSCLPMTYAFRAMRSVVQTGIMPRADIIMCLLLNIVYLVGAFLFFKRMLHKSKNVGLTNL